MVTVTLAQPTFAAWRTQARRLLHAGIPPGDLLWTDPSQHASLLPASSTETAGTSPGTDTEALDTPRTITAPAAFLSVAERAAAHTDPRRWSLLYRLLYRLTHGRERHLLSIPSDPDVRQARLWEKAVGRDIHKMHAFVRFRLIGQDPASGREQFVAWFEPTHGIVRLATPFFVKRFAGMDWSILTPLECAHWDGRNLTYTPGLDRKDAPAADAHDDLWRTYYRSIFNPARLKVKAMKSEMPVKYWKNLPEARLIPELINDASARVESMLETPARPELPAPNNAYLRHLKSLPRPPEEPAP